MTILRVCAGLRECARMCVRTAKGKVWGSDEVNVEGWKPLKRLVGHESGASTLPLRTIRSTHTAGTRRYGRRMVPGRPVPCFSGAGLGCAHMVRIHSRYVAKVLIQDHERRACL